MVIFLWNRKSLTKQPFLILHLSWNSMQGGMKLMLLPCTSRIRIQIKMISTMQQISCLLFCVIENRITHERWFYNLFFVLLRPQEVVYPIIFYSIAHWSLRTQHFTTYFTKINKKANNSLPRVKRNEKKKTILWLK